MESILFGIGVLLMMSGWRYVWRPTTLDDTRDRLFDLREEVRSEFVRRGLSLDHPLYIALRDLLNGHLRYTERASFAKLVSVRVAIDKDPAAQSELRAHIERRFHCPDQGLATFARQVRDRAGIVMLGYVIETSPFALLLAVIGVGVLVAHQVWSFVVRGARLMSPQMLSRAAVLTSALFATLQPVHATRSDAQAVMEECALRAT